MHTSAAAIVRPRTAAVVRPPAATMRSPIDLLATHSQAELASPLKGAAGSPAFSWRGMMCAGQEAGGGRAALAGTGSGERVGVVAL